MLRSVRGLAVLACVVALVSGVLANAPAQASGSWSVVWNGTSLVPSSVPASVGDGIVLTKVGGGVGDTIAVRNSTGQLKSGAGICNGGPDCEIDAVLSLSMSVLALGDVLIQIGGNTVATLQLTGGDGASGEYTMTFDGNGATSCTPASVSGAATSAYRLPGPASCQRPGYRLLGWSRNQAAIEPDNANLTQNPQLEQGPQALFADNGTLYAVWEPVDGFEITYDSNVGWYMPCITDSGETVNDVVTWSARLNAMEVVTNKRVTTQLQTRYSLPRQTALCKPEWLVLSGWSTSPALAFGDPTSEALKNVSIRLNQAFGDSALGLRNGDRLTLYAMWTLPKVTVHRMNYASQTFDEAEGPKQLAWGSTVPLYPLSVSGLLSPNTATVTCSEALYQPVERSALMGMKVWLDVRDTRDVPAPYTSVILGADNASLDFSYPKAGSGVMLHTKTGPNGVAVVQTGDNGIWPATSPRFGSFYMQTASLLVNVCPPAPGKAVGSSTPSMWVLTGAAPGYIGRIPFDPEAYFAKK